MLIPHCNMDYTADVMNWTHFSSFIFIFIFSCLQVGCCGADSPQDWIDYNSTFRTEFGTEYPWPQQCCKRLSNHEVADVEGCKIGLNSTLFSKVG